MRRLFITLCLALLACHAQYAQAEDLKRIINDLKPLTLHEGSNPLTINGYPAVIIKARRDDDTAWGGIGFTAIIHHQASWQYIRPTDSDAKDVTVWSAPHTDEDAITSIVFMIPKGATPNNTTHLYLLKTHRAYEESPLVSVPAKFSLYILKQDEDFGGFYMHLLKQELSKETYCDADTAAFHELSIALPAGKEAVPCIK